MASRWQLQRPAMLHKKMSGCRRPLNMPGQSPDLANPDRYPVRYPIQYPDWYPIRYLNSGFSVALLRVWGVGGALYHGTLDRILNRARRRAERHTGPGPLSVGGIEDGAEEGPWSRIEASPTPEWLAAATEHSLIVCLYGPMLGVRCPPESSPATWSATARAEELRRARGLGMVAGGIIGFRQVS